METLAKIDYGSHEVIETIKATVAKGATNAQLAQFLEVCKSTGLNPFLKEIWCIPATNTIMASRDGYLRVANENPEFDGMETTVERDANHIPVKAICKVYRKDRKYPITCEAYYDEYRKDSQVWRQYPSAMISKVAEVMALKRSFAINGVTTQEEISSEMRSTGEGEALDYTPEPHALPSPVLEEVPFIPIEEPVKQQMISPQFSKDAETTKQLLRIACKQLVKKNPSFTEEEYLRELLHSNEVTFAHIEKVSAPSKIKKLEKALEEAERQLKQ